MRVLFITNIPSPYQVCFSNELGKHCNLTVLYELKKASDRNENWQEFQAKHFKAIFLEGKQKTHETAKCPDVKKYLTTEYDIIVVGGYSSPTAQVAIKHLHKKRIPFIIDVNGAFIPKKENFLKKWYKKHLISKASLWITGGENTKKHLIHYGANPDKVLFYPCTSVYESEIIDNKTNKELIKKELNITEKKIIVSIGAFIPRKGMDTVLKAAKNFTGQDIGFYLIGGEPTSEYLELAQGNKKIYFIRHLPKKEILKYLVAADLFVFMTQEDIWGRVINEAIACGLPVITTDMCNAGLEIIENDKNGYILSVGDVNGLQKKIQEYMTDDKKLKQLSEASLETARHYTYENNTQRHIEIFKKFLAR